jgi:hypothetical protein
MSSKPQFQLAASLSVVSEAPGRGILPGVSRYTAALPVLYRLSRPFTQDPFSPNANNVSFELLRRFEQPTALVHGTICERVHSRVANATP